MSDQTLKNFIETLHDRAKKLATDCPEARKYMEGLLPEAFESKVSDFQEGNIVLCNGNLQLPRLLIKYDGKTIFVDLISRNNMIAAVYSWANRQEGERAHGYKLAPDCDILIEYRNGKIVGVEVKEV